MEVERVVTESRPAYVPMREVLKRLGECEATITRALLDDPRPAYRMLSLEELANVKARSLAAARRASQLA